jgi:hypothetical protein
MVSRACSSQEGARYDDFGAGLGGVKEDKVQRHVPGGQFTSSTAPTSTQAAAAVGAMASKRLGNLQQSGAHSCILIPLIKSLKKLYLKNR